MAFPPAACRERSPSSRRCSSCSRARASRIALDRAPTRSRSRLRRSETVEVDGARRSLPASPKYTEPLRDIPQTITVIPRAVIEEQNATTLRDVLRNVPGITIQAGEGGVPAGDNLTIRGFSARTDIFVDGVRDFGGYSRDPYNLEQVEVTKGPASSYSGRGSTGGSVNLVSKTPQRAAGRAASTVGGGTEAYKRGTLDLNQPLDGLGTGRRAPGQRHVHGHRRGAARRGGEPALGRLAVARLRPRHRHARDPQLLAPRPGQRARLRHPLGARGHHGPARRLRGRRRRPSTRSNFYGLTARDYEKTKTDLATGTFEHDFGAQLTLRNQLRYGRNDRDSVITAPRFVNASSPTVYTQINRQLQSRDMTDTIVSNQTSLTARFATGQRRARARAGLEFGREESINYLRTGPTAPLADLFDPEPRRSLSRARSRAPAPSTTATPTLGAVYAFDTLQPRPEAGADGRPALGPLRGRLHLEGAPPAWSTPFGRTDDMSQLARRRRLQAEARTAASTPGSAPRSTPRPRACPWPRTTSSLEPEKTRQLRGRHQVGPPGAAALADRRDLPHREDERAHPGRQPRRPAAGARRASRTVNGVELGAFGSIGTRVTALRRLRPHVERDRGLEHRGRDGQRPRPDPGEHLQPLADLPPARAT